MSYIPESIFEQITKLKQSGNYDEALKLANQILIKDPANTDGLLQVADIEYIKGNIDKAEKPIDFLLKYKGENDPMGLYVKGVLEMEKTNWEGGKKYLKKALKLSNSDNPEILRCYSLCEYWSGNREQGLDLLERAFDLNNKDAEILYNIIELTLLEHKYDKASSLISYFYKNRDNLQMFDKEIGFYDQKISLFNEYLNTLK